MIGIDGLRRVRAGLLDSGVQARDRLRAAALTFETTAAVAYPGWPVRLQVKADGIRAVLFRHGVPEVTVGRLPEAEVDDAVASLRRFCDEAAKVAEPETSSG